MTAGTTSWAMARPGAIERHGHAVLFLVAAAFAAAVLWHFHDRFWWPPDEGAYAHVADRILAGDVLNRDVQDIHFGYVNFVNALALDAFGENLLALRYPLVAMAFAQSCLIFLLLSPRGAVLAFAGSVCLTCLSLIQFLNPTAHWYSLFIFVVIIAAVTWLPKTFPGRLVILGFLGVLLIMFRQLTGVFVSIGVISLLLCEEAGSQDGPRRRVARALITGMALGILVYFFTKADLVALIMFGLWPLGALAWAWQATTCDDRRAARIIVEMTVGGILAAAPLLGYHLVHGSLPTWLDDTLGAALSLTGLDFMRGPSYAILPGLGIQQIVASGGTAPVINGLFWIVLPLVPILLGVLTVRELWRPSESRRRLHALPYLAIFYGMVSAHYQIPIYLFYTVGIATTGVLWLAASWSTPSRLSAVALGCVLAATALFYHAAQPLARGIGGTLAGETRELMSQRWGDRVMLHVEETDAVLYDYLVSLVDAHVPPGRPILAIPFNPELYFITQRPNPFRFYNSAFGLRSPDQLRAVLDAIRQDPPKLVFFRPKDKYNTPGSRHLMRAIRQKYDLIEVRDGFEIYLVPAGND